MSNTNAIPVTCYDYLNFVQFYISYGRSRAVNMPFSTRAGIPLLSDAFPYGQRFLISKISNAVSTGLRFQKF